MPIYTLINDDCFKIMAGIADKSINVSFTSPPYNRKRNDKYTYYDDTISDYYSFLHKAITEMIRVTKGTVFLNIQKNYYNKIEVLKIIGEFANQISEIFIWEKSNPMPASGFSVTNSYEFIIAFGKPLKSNRTYTKNHMTTSVARMLPEHKAIMKYEIAEAFIKDFTQPNDIVLDPFNGISTTGIACKNLGRNFIGIELNKIYNDLAMKRMDLCLPTFSHKSLLPTQQIQTISYNK